MKRVTGRPRHVLPAVVVLALLAGWMLDVGGGRHLLREASFDWLLPRVSGMPTTSAVMVVDIDRDTLAHVGPWPWPRARLAELLGAIVAAEPAAIGVDILLDGSRSSHEQDDRVAGALAQVPTVQGLALDDRPAAGRLPPPRILLRGRPDLPGIWTAESAIGPPPVIAATAAGLGVIVLLPDNDGRIRRVPLLTRVEDGLRPGMAVELTRVAIGAAAVIVDATSSTLGIGSLSVPLGLDAQLRVVASPEAGWARRTVSAGRVMSDPAIRARLANQVVLVGSGAPEVGGLRVTPVSAATPSVQVHADALNMIAHGILPATPAWARAAEVAAAALLALLAAVLSLAGRPLVATLVVMAGTTAWAGAGALLAGSAGRLVDPAGPAAIALLAFGTFSVAGYADNVRRARALRARFEQHLAPEVVQQLAANPDLLRLEGEAREITALFTDIEGFTSMTERSDARKLVALLDEYLDAVTQVVISHGGLVEKVVGDAVHAIFNAPLDLVDHPRRAFDCALEILAVSQQVQARPLAQELGLGRTRIGLETGVAIVGDVGGRRKLDYTAHGTAMNTAARLEAANKELGSSICIGPSAARRLDPSLVSPLGELALRGLSERLTVYTPAVLTRPEPG